jgi:hypothetical protein
MIYDLIKFWKFDIYKKKYFKRCKDQWYKNLMDWIVHNSLIIEVLLFQQLLIKGILILESKLYYLCRSRIQNLPSYRK